MNAHTKKWISLSVILGVAAVGSIWSYTRWRHGQLFVETENAYVKGHVVSVASRLPGPLLEVRVRENEAVKAGQVLAVVDVRDFDALTARAEASLSEAQNAVSLNEAQIAQAEAQLVAAESQKSLADLEKARLTALVERQSIPRQKLDHANTAAQVAEAQVNAARKQIAAARGARGVSASKVAGAQAAVKAAKLQRSYCEILAPCDGFVSRKMAEPGAVVAPGQPLLALVPLDQKELWVEANFKETQLARIRPGQKVQLRLDSDHSRVFSGTVDSLAAGTGSVFSLLPPENATGNWVKVVQRIPVKIKLDPSAEAEGALRLGLSMTVTVDTRS